MLVRERTRPAGVRVGRGNAQGVSPLAEGKGGLEDVVACDSEICFIDGKQGRLLYRGYDITELAGRVSFEAVCYALWYGDLPGPAELAALRQRLAAARTLPAGLLALLRQLPPARPMMTLRTAVSALGLYDPERDDNSLPACQRKAERLTAQMATVVAAMARIAAGQEPVAPRPDLGHAANVLYMLRGSEADPLQVEAMDVALVLHADHELNASTFSARVTAATLADMHAAITSAVGTLEGPLHGGANENVMRMLLEIGSPERAPAYVREQLARGVKIPGFGHRVYKTEDPRATILRRMSHDLGQRAGNTLYYDITRAVEQAVFEEKRLYPNVDLYSASTYYAMGIPIELFTPIFAVSRISGWSAHVLEQYAHNRLIRPRAEYVGPAPRPVPAGA
jgi:citrate synthase